MQTIWKQDVTEDARQTFEWPQGASIVAAAMQNGRPRVWFLCNPEKPKVERKFMLVPTGGPISPPAGTRTRHVASFQLFGGKIVAHLLEIERI